MKSIVTSFYKFVFDFTIVEKYFVIRKIFRANVEVIIF